METITHNVHNQYVRQATEGGKDYLVAPVAMLVPGVHKGSGGALLYTKEELAKRPGQWNGVPVTVGHPAIGGVPVAVAEVGTSQTVGMIRNAHWDHRKLRAEAWLEVERLRQLAPSVLTALEQGKPMEVSTGLFTDNVPAPSANYGGQGNAGFTKVATNFRPDHLALLVTGKGACAVVDGCGLLQMNKESEMDYDESPLLMPTMDFGPPTNNGCGCSSHQGASHDAMPVVAPSSWPQQQPQPHGNLGSSTPLVADYLEGAAYAMRADGHADAAGELDEVVANVRGQSDEAPLLLPDWGYGHADAGQVHNSQQAAQHSRDDGPLVMAAIDWTQTG
ncbi:hypothetical protein FF011L_06150 [Roseimaritima multifibrata]|uniref:Uncharacterized protein n=1 Tax=Roseimaritima multifibrata TaxID=1930274 RepID=A0A517MAG3_9BACT|nr:hypothetical protein [Roseimaritima multifibrata]QDS91879.1 hypothetical protein FF011L_06150 [Roseimaritima multifibrata]